MAYQDAAPGEPLSIESLSDSTDSQRAGAFHYRVDGDRWDWTQGIATMHGYHREAVQLNLELLLQHTHFEDRTRVAVNLHRVVQGQRVGSRHRIIDRAGDIHWIVLVSDPMKNENGDIVGSSGYFVDVSDAVQVGVTAAVSELAKSRAVIEQAKGVLIAAHGISADQAFDRLVRRSQETNTKLRDVAGHLIATMSGKLSTKAPTDIFRNAPNMPGRA